MARRKLTWWDLAICLAIVFVLAGILLPPLRPRPVMYTRVRTPPLAFDQAPLNSVMERLDQEMQRKGRFSISHVEWEDETLKSRPVTFRTETDTPLGEIIARIEASAQVKIDDSGGCATCGGPITVPTIRDAAGGPEK